jgi:hypothetical protein
MAVATTGKHPVTLTTAFLLLASISAVSLVLYSHKVHSDHHEEFGGREFGFHGQGDGLQRTKHVGGGGGGHGHAHGGHIDWHGEYRSDGAANPAEEEEEGEEGEEGEEAEEGQGHDESNEGEEGGHSDSVDDSGEDSSHHHGGAPHKSGGKPKAGAQVLSRQWVSQAGRGSAAAYNHMAMVSRLKNGTFLATWWGAASRIQLPHS